MIGQGGFPGISSALHACSSGYTVIVLANISDIAGMLTGFILDQLPKEKMVTPIIDQKLYELYSGVYELSPQVHITVTHENNRLFKQKTGYQKFELLPRSEVLFIEPVSHDTWTFVKNGDGVVQKVVVKQGGGEYHLPKVK